jgi:hypothetical protein
VEARSAEVDQFLTTLACGELRMASQREGCGCQAELGPLASKLTSGARIDRGANT